jgi:muconate cycloisomerase
LQKLSESIAEDVVVDESLCTLKQAEELAKDKVCNAFNVRLSKAGGMLAAQEMIDIALAHKLKVHLGAQVGETGILSAAARQLAICNEAMENYEGSANMFLLKQDICRENLNAGPGGFANLKYAGKNAGLGLKILDERLLSMTGSSEEQMPDVPQSPSKNSAVSQQRAS